MLMAWVSNACRSDTIHCHFSDIMSIATYPPRFRLVSAPLLLRFGLICTLRQLPASRPGFQPAFACGWVLAHSSGFNFFVHE